MTFSPAMALAARIASRKVYSATLQPSSPGSARELTVKMSAPRESGAAQTDEAKVMPSRAMSKVVRSSVTSRSFLRKLEGSATTERCAKPAAHARASIARTELRPGSISARFAGFQRLGLQRRRRLRPGMVRLDRPAGHLPGQRAAGRDHARSPRVERAAAAGAG